MRIERLDIEAVSAITPARHGDERGYFAETYSRAALAAHGIEDTFVQDNHAYSHRRGTVRGLHFQVPPHAQAKLVRVVRGAVYDVAVDLRRGSPTYGHFVGAVLSARNGMQLHIPAGFAHGLCTLEDDTEVLYKASDFYAPAHEGALRWDDPAVGIPWPLGGTAPTISARDAAAPLLTGFDSPFAYP
ncbi:MAG: dTDP-4-dehydrorhamnose 3,5-epimerase [Alphaproteobacteria bacterium]